MKHKQKPITEEEFHDHWAQSIDEKDIDVIAQFEGSTSPEYRYAIKSLGNVRGKKILNLGSGLGEEAVYLAKKGAHVTAIDISKKMLSLTARLAKRYGIKNNIIYRHASAEKLPFAPETFDIVLGCNILHHVDIKQSLKEVQKVLKPSGKAVFIEPLACNPVINIYRKMANHVRTEGEQPLNGADLNSIRSIFPTMKHREFQLLTLLIFVWFYAVEFNHPNETRYWKKIIKENKKYSRPFGILYALDIKVLKLLPFLRKYCWVTVMEMKKN